MLYVFPQLTTLLPRHAQDVNQNPDLSPPVFSPADLRPLHSLPSDYAIFQQPCCQQFCWQPPQVRDPSNSASLQVRAPKWSALFLPLIYSFTHLPIYSPTSVKKWVKSRYKHGTNHITFHRNSSKFRRISRFFLTHLA